MLSWRRSLLIFVGAIGLAHSAHAHGIAGNRYFPGTLAFDDPAVADELLFDYATLQHPAEDGGPVRDNAAPITFMRLLTPDLAFGAGTTGIVRSRNNFPQQAGFDNVDLTLKAMLFRSDPHEILLSAAITWEIGGTGNAAVGGDKPNILQPGIFYGKGFGDLPIAWGGFARLRSPGRQRPNCQPPTPQPSLVSTR